MIKLRQCRLSVRHSEEDLKKKAASCLRIRPEEIRQIRILKQSMDARKKDALLFVYELAVDVTNEKEVLKKNRKNADVEPFHEDVYRFSCENAGSAQRPVIVGLGPCGLFAAYLLALHGFAPIVIERGASVEERARIIEGFWNGESLDPETNVSFGEGGAGAFSDGKLNTLIKDKEHRGHYVLQTFVDFGADPEILYLAKPHIGTDRLRGVVAGMHRKIEELGGEIRTHCRMDKLLVKDSRIEGLVYTDLRSQETVTLKSDHVILAIGHSARDTFTELLQEGVPMEAKPFAVGVRIQHSQDWLDKLQYGDASEFLPPADYKVTARASDGRGVFSFCMCPGGYVVNASSEPKRLVVNGMSYHDRAGANCNSAIVVSVNPEDFEGTDVLRGMHFQRRLEEKAYEAGHGAVPIERWRDFYPTANDDLHRLTEEDLTPQIKGAYEWADLTQVLPEFLSRAIKEGILAFDRKMPGFAAGDAILAAIESRTSSPVRIPRDETLQSSIRGLYPCGEGAGYAGGIMSAAIDGMRIAEETARSLNQDR